MTKTWYICNYGPLRLSRKSSERYRYEIQAKKDAADFIRRNFPKEAKHIVLHDIVCRRASVEDNRSERYFQIILPDGQRVNIHRSYKPNERESRTTIFKQFKARFGEGITAYELKNGRRVKMGRTVKRRKTTLKRRPKAKKTPIKAKKAPVKRRATPKQKRR